MSQVILVADELGNHTGEYIDKDLAHTGRGKRHMAITVLLSNSEGHVLLQHRKHKIHNNIWDFTGSTHHLHKNNGSDETTEEAVYRCLRDEYGIEDKMPLRVIGGVNYFAKNGEYCENEHDLIVLGEYSGKLKLNKSVAYDFKWVKKKQFITDISRHPKKYAPWVVAAFHELVIFDDEFKVLLSDFLKEFEAYSHSFFKKKKIDVGKYPKLVSRFYSDLDDISAGGKRMRAFLVYLGYLIGGGKDLKKILPISLAVEIIHTFLLIHDDIIDKSDIRRGKLTIHKRYEKIFGVHYGLSNGILIGDIACFEAMELVNSSSFHNAAKIECGKRLNKVLLETAYGEALDVEYSYKKAKITGILKVADLKTARYSFVGPMTIGGILGGASRKQLLAIEKFGLKIGLAFQLVDDLLGVFGDERILGKSTLSDMREGKNTLLIYKAKELANARDKKVLEKLWGKRSATLKDLEVVKKIIRSSRAYDWCRVEMKRLHNQAISSIDHISNDSEYRKVLRQISNFIVSRSS